MTDRPIKNLEMNENLKNRLSFMAAIMTLFAPETKTSSLIFTYLTDVRRWIVVQRKLLL